MEDIRCRSKDKRNVENLKKKKKKIGYFVFIARFVERGARTREKLMMYLFVGKEKGKKKEKVRVKE